MNVMQQPGTDLTYGTVLETRAQMVRPFFVLHLYLARKYCENPEVPRAQLNVNPARAITWFVGVTTYCTRTFAITIHLHLASFYATKYF